MKSTRVDRRTVLRAGAGYSLALPLLEAMCPTRRVHAAAHTERRLLIWMQPLSIYADVFWPAAPGTKPYDWKVDPMKEVYWSGQGSMDNREFQLPELLASWAPHRNDLLFVEGLENSGGNHPAYSTSLTGTNGFEKSPDDMVSIDQLIAKRLEPPTKFRTLQVGVNNAGAGAGAAVSWHSKAQAAPATDNPIRLWERLFSDVSADPSQARRLREKKRSVLDAALGQASQLRASLGRADREKIDQYLAAFRDVEMRLDAGAEVGCRPPEKTKDTSPTTGKALFDGDELDRIDDTPLVMKQQIELIAMAFACDLTRIGTFQFGAEANNGTFPWLGLPDWRWHDASHFENDKPAEWPAQLQFAEGWRAVAKWSLEQFGQLVQRLKDFGAFDNTMAMFMTSMNHGGAHKARNCPIVIAGSGGGALRTGRHVRIPHALNGGGVTRRFNDLHITLARAMGVELSKFGDDDKSKGPIEELLT